MLLEEFTGLGQVLSCLSQWHCHRQQSYSIDLTDSPEKTSVLVLLPLDFIFLAGRDCVSFISTFIAGPLLMAAPGAW